MLDFGKMLGDLITGYLLSNPSTMGLGLKIQYGSSNNTSTIENATKAEPETVTAQRYDYKTSTDAFGGNPSVPHAGSPRDTVVRKGDESVVNKLNTRDSVKQAKVTQRRNTEYNKKMGY